MAYLATIENYTSRADGAAGSASRRACGRMTGYPFHPGGLTSSITIGDDSLAAASECAFLRPCLGRRCTPEDWLYAHV